MVRVTCIVSILLALTCLPVSATDLAASKANSHAGPRGGFFAPGTTPQSPAGARTGTLFPQTAAYQADDDEDDDDEADGFWVGWSPYIGAGSGYLSKPARSVSSKGDHYREWHAGVEKDFSLATNLTLTPSFGVDRVRFASQTDLNADEYALGLMLAWKPSPHWSLSLRQESYWDHSTSVAADEFSTHALVLRTQRDFDHSSSQHGRAFVEFATVRASDRQQSLASMALGLNHTISLLPKRLQLNLDGRLVYLRYQRAALDNGVRRQGWDGFVNAAIVWRPWPWAELSGGVEWRRFDEGTAPYRFNALHVPIRLTANF